MGCSQPIESFAGVKWRFHPICGDIAAGILTQSGRKPVVAEFLTLQAAKSLRLRAIKAAKG